ncbi:MAG: FecR domain-containing protein, partial [Erysipelotrichaceae bacterium]|nr:FecR domain-containing protein [Erysipelotrichaceae bacterium]
FDLYAMKRAEDISILITDKKFQKLLSEWPGFNEEKKAEVYSEYGLTAKDVEILLQLWFGLDFHSFERPKALIEEALAETIWQLSERKNAHSGKRPIKRLYEQFARIAAILIIPIILYTTYIQFFKVNQDLAEATSQLITVSSQAGTITNTTLPDGSKVYLNAGSSISYPNHFDGSTRNVLLTGEAYFQVVKNKKVPMVVSAGNVDLKVYGTSFNVNAFPSEASVRVTLVEGSISLSFKSGKLKGKDEFFIEPGQTVTYLDDSTKMTIKNEDTFFYTAWKDGILVFKNNTFASVLKQLSRKFNVDIELKDQSLASIPMDATFRDEDINEIIRLLALGTPFKYYYESPEKLPDGTFAKSKIYIVKN